MNLTYESDLNERSHLHLNRQERQKKVRKTRYIHMCSMQTKFSNEQIHLLVFQ